MPKGAEQELMEKWKIQDALETYGVRNWGKGYFGINKAGPRHRPSRTSGPTQAIDLKELVDQLQARGIQLPILLRFTDILRHRVGEIHDAFQTRHRRSTTTRAATAASTRSRSISSATSSRRSSTSASRSTSAWRPAPSRSCSPCWP